MNDDDSGLKALVSILQNSLNSNYFFKLKHTHKSYPEKLQYIRFIRYFLYVFVSFHFLSTIAIASGGYDNGTATGKGKLGLDLTWNPFNYFPEGQSYLVLSYGFSDKFDIHGYYSIPASGSDNYI